MTFFLQERNCDFQQKQQNNYTVMKNSNLLCGSRGQTKTKTVLNRLLCTSLNYTTIVWSIVHIEFIAVSRMFCGKQNIKQ